MAVRLPHNLLIYSTNWYIFGSTTVEHKFFLSLNVTLQAVYLYFLWFYFLNKIIWILNVAETMLICNLYKVL